MNSLHLNAYRSALDELALIPYCFQAQQFEAVKLAIDCLCEIPQLERPKYCRLAIGNLVLRNTEKANYFIELALSKCENN